ncbi:MAG TPA: NADPH-dependent F420 reductase [Solirubrobacteraceae bacterium]|nr:NADPH-dependent F420 reductase [Solirubrobacteraceae bacterium]
MTVIGGTGALGFGLAARLATAGTPVVIGSRDAGRAEEAAHRVRALAPEGELEGAVNDAAARRSDVVFLCVPFRNQSENLTNLKPALREGQLLVDATVPLAAAVSGRATRMLGVWQGSAAQQAEEMAPDGVRVVSALHSVSADALGALERPLDEDVLICGDRRADKAQAAEILHRIPGLRCVDAGRLEMSRIAETLTALLISINAKYKAHAGIRVANLPDHPHEAWPRPSSS